MDSERVDLICTAPPFNSGRNYNAFFKDSKAQNKAFTDIWTWDTEAEKARASIENPDNNRTYPKLQFWQIGDDYFGNPDMVNSIIQLPPEWLRPIQKSERHFSDEQHELGID